MYWIEMPEHVMLWHLLFLTEENYFVIREIRSELEGWESFSSFIWLIVSVISNFESSCDEMPEIGTHFEVSSLEFWKEPFSPPTQINFLWHH